VSLKDATVVSLGAVIIFGVLLHFSKDHAGTSTPVKAAAFSRQLGETFQCTHGFLAAFTAKDAKKVGELIRAGDKKALEVMALQGRIIAVKTGTTVTIEDRDIWNTTESFRVQGNPDTRYASIGQVR